MSDVFLYAVGVYAAAVAQHYALLAFPSGEHMVGHRLIAADMLGTTGAPYVLHIDGTATGIDGNVTSHTNLPNGIYTVGGQRVNNVTQPGLYIIKTTGLDGSTTVRKQVVK